VYIHVLYTDCECVCECVFVRVILHAVASVMHSCFLAVLNEQEELERERKRKEDEERRLREEEEMKKRFALPLRI